MRRITLPMLAFALVACAEVATEPLPPTTSLLIGGMAQVTNVTWTTSTTGVAMVAIGQYNNNFTMLVDINDEGQAVGWGFEQTTSGLRERAISWRNGAFTPLPGLGGPSSRAKNVNNAGVIVGEAQNASNRLRPVIWENGAIRALPPLMTPPGAGSAIAINERGDVVGRENDLSGFAHAVLWPVGGGIVDLGMLPDASSSWGTGINRNGTVFGQSIFFSPTLFRRATMWQGSPNPVEVTLPTDGQPIGADVGTGQMYNDAGNFLLEVGRPSFGRAVLFVAGAFQTLPLLPGALSEITRPYGLNEAADVVGSASGPSSFQPVLWPRSGPMLNLGVPVGFTSGDAHGVNNRGLAIGAANGPWRSGAPVGMGVVLWQVPMSDGTPPVIVYSDHPAVYAIDQHVSITCTVTDEGSGVGSHTCADINGDAYTFGLGVHTFTATATDNVGNSATASTSFTVAATFSSLGTLMTRFVTDAEIASNLLHHLQKAEQARAEGKTKLEEAQLRAFSNIVKAQTGTSITPENAALLLQLAGLL